MSTVVYKRLRNVLLFVLTLSAYLFDTRPSHQLVFGGVTTIAAVVSMALYFHGTVFGVDRKVFVLSAVWGNIQRRHRDKYASPLASRA